MRNLVKVVRVAFVALESGAIDVDCKLFLIYEACFQLYLQGNIGGVVWNSKMDALKVLLRNPVVLGWWQSRMTPMSQEFRDHLERLIPTESTWQHISIATEVEESR